MKWTLVEAYLYLQIASIDLLPVRTFPLHPLRFSCLISWHHLVTIAHIVTTMFRKKICQNLIVLVKKRKKNLLMNILIYSKIVLYRKQNALKAEYKRESKLWPWTFPKSCDQRNKIFPLRSEFSGCEWKFSWIEIGSKAL